MLVIAYFDIVDCVRKIDKSISNYVNTQGITRLKE